MERNNIVAINKLVRRSLVLINLKTYKVNYLCVDYHPAVLPHRASPDRYKRVRSELATVMISLEILRPRLAS